ncbi:hypothetical protein K2P97_05010 [bacterium]|nr:hypothetical protein [bacterium]
MKKNLEPIDIKKALKALNKELKAKNVSDVIYTLGGAALYLMGYDERATTDVDDLRDVMDGSIYECSVRVAKKLGISEFWLNTGVAPIQKFFDEGWKKKCNLVFSDTNLKVYAVDRQTLINTKLAAVCQRPQGGDENDLVWLKANKKEFKLAKKYVKKNYSNIPVVVIDAFIAAVLNG